ncbi:IclR family transcriptional regulator [Spongiactinospora gelatinilytica]|uniref:IclR family transcriptional regulator n=1 Tax=Spongiactinospora gelatinilytica TaxID=2666298 RepID=A0A2W2HLU1_9ACTN|nr:IclR family transcriptional regulator [Spongiactinospora gelatinilytica]PZG56079.1 IclR family transcriptional regulator [Spongiactinospora gelatinilytica]
MAGNTGSPGASLAGRLFAVLGSFTMARPDLSLTEIARATGLPISTTRRLIGELVAWGALERTPEDRYRIGMRLWAVGTLAPQRRGLSDSALPYMNDLFLATREAVQLVVLDGTEALCVEKVSGTTAVRNETQVGGRLPLHATAVGKCLLAWSPPDLLARVIEGGLDRRTMYTITEPGRLHRHLRQVRARGVAYSREEMTLGAVSVAAPILTGQGRLHGALGIVVRSAKRLDNLAAAVLTSSVTISRQIA